MTVEERIARLEALVVLLFDQLQYAFPGGEAFKGQRQKSPDFSGENTHTPQDVYDPASGTHVMQHVVHPDALDFARARFENIKARIEEVRKELP